MNKNELSNFADLSLKDPPVGRDTGHTSGSPLWDPISLLPNELVAKIFETFVEEWEQKWAESFVPLRNFLYTIIGVCKRWHLIATTTPRLWRNIVYERVWEDSVWTCPIMVHCTVRSGAIPLSIVIARQHNIEHFFRHLPDFGVANRVGSLALSGSPNQLTSDTIMACLQGGNLQQLEALSLDNFEELSTTGFFIFLRESYKLRRLSMGAVSMLPMERHEKVHLPHLRALYLLELDVRSIDFMLSSITTSTSLRLIIWPTGKNPLPFDCSGPIFKPVHELTLGLVPKNLGVIRDLLHRTPDLEVLTLFRSGSGAINVDRTFDVLRHREAGVVLPHLHTLSFYDVAFSLEAMHGVIDHRASVQIPVRRIGLSSKELRALSAQERWDLAEKVEVFQWKPEWL